MHACLACVQDAAALPQGTYVHALANFFLLRGAEEERGAYNRYNSCPTYVKVTRLTPQAPPPPFSNVSQHAVNSLLCLQLC